MRRKAAVTGLVSLVVLLFGTVALFAVEEGSAAKEKAEPGMMRGGMMGQGMMGEGMMVGGMGPMCPMCAQMMQMKGRGAGAEKLLLLADKLQLSPEQKEELAELKLEQKVKMIELKAEAEKAEARLEGLLSAEETDLAAVRKLVFEIAEVRGELEFGKIEGTVKAKRLLTEEQRDKLKELSAKGMMPGMGSGMKGGPMMQGEGSGMKGGQMMQGERSGMKQGGMMKPAEEGSATK
jgi:Spy/CpxP family protein refolding chaperone